jgi:hypothetical protein
MVPQSDIKAGHGQLLDDDNDESDLEDQMMGQIQQEDPIQSHDPMPQDDPIIKNEPVFDNEYPDSSPDMKDDSPVQESPVEKHKVDVFNDPLLPEDEEMDYSSNKKRPRADSFEDKNQREAIEDEGEEGIAFDDLNPEEKVAVLHQLYEEYNRDPDSFPEDQLALLEEELKNMMDKGYIAGPDEEEGESEMDERMQAEGEINFPTGPIPVTAEDEENKAFVKQEEELDIQEVDMKRSSQDIGENKGKLHFVIHSSRNHGSV